MRSQFAHLVMTGAVTEPCSLRRKLWHKDTGKYCVEAEQALRGRDAVPAKHTLEPTCLAGTVQDRGLLCAADDDTQGGRPADRRKCEES